MRGALSLALVGLLLAGCMPGRATFRTTAHGEGVRPASDPAAHSTARVRREGSQLVIQDVYRADLRRLIDVDREYQERVERDEAGMTRDEALITAGLHAAFGLGVFRPALERLDSDWARRIMARTRVGVPFFVRSVSPGRASFHVVPVFYQERWGVSSHVAATVDGRYYSDGFCVIDRPIEAAGTASAVGRANVLRWAAAHGMPAPEVERVYLEQSPPPEDVLVAYAWWVRQGERAFLLDRRGQALAATASLGPEGIVQPVRFPPER